MLNMLIRKVQSAKYNIYLISYNIIYLIWLYHIISNLFHFLLLVLILNEEQIHLQYYIQMQIYHHSYKIY